MHLNYKVLAYEFAPPTWEVQITSQDFFYRHYLFLKKGQKSCSAML